MDGRIVIELGRGPTPPSGSGLPDLAHTAYQLMKVLKTIEYKDVSGKMRPLGDHYEVLKVTTEVERH